MAFLTPKVHLELVIENQHVEVFHVTEGRSVSFRHSSQNSIRTFSVCFRGSEHARFPNLRDRSNSNMVERLHGTIRQRNKVMRGLDDEQTAQTMMNGLRIYYNFVRPHMALDGKTLAQKARIADTSTPENWLSLIKKASQHQRQ